VQGCPRRGEEWEWGLNSGLHACKVGTQPLESYLQFILLWFFFLRWSLMNYLPELAWNHDPPDLSLLSSYDYCYEPLVPGPGNIS
jgi:hypothetical protein